jgi:hypothetical protein
VQLPSEPDSDYICCTDLDSDVGVAELPEPVAMSAVRPSCATDLDDVPRDQSTVGMIGADCDCIYGDEVPRSTTPLEPTTPLCRVELTSEADYDFVSRSMSMVGGASTVDDFILSNDLLESRASCDDMVQLRSEPDSDYICCTDLDDGVHTEPVALSAVRLSSATDRGDVPGEQSTPRMIGVDCDDINGDKVPQSTTPLDTFMYDDEPEPTAPLTDLPFGVDSQSIVDSASCEEGGRNVQLVTVPKNNGDICGADVDVGLLERTTLLNDPEDTKQTPVAQDYDLLRDTPIVHPAILGHRARSDVQVLSEPDSDYICWTDLDIDDNHVHVAEIPEPTALSAVRPSSATDCGDIPSDQSAVGMIECDYIYGDKVRQSTTPLEPPTRRRVELASEADCDIVSSDKSMVDGASTKHDFILSDDLVGSRASSDDVAQLLSEPDNNCIRFTDLDCIRCTDLDSDVHVTELPEPAAMSAVRLSSATDLDDVPRDHATSLLNQSTIADTYSSCDENLE